MCVVIVFLFFVGELVDGRWGSFVFDVLDMILDIRLGDFSFFGVIVVELIVWYWFGEDVNKNW